MAKLTEQIREKWNTKVDFLFVTMGSAIGLGNLWRFPYLCYENGGGAFLIPYCISLFLIALPHLILQVALGQFTGKSSTKAWNIVPIMRGLGFACVVIAYATNVIYGTIISWSIRYMYSSFSKVLPWSSCDNVWNNENCSVFGQETQNGTNFLENNTKVSSAVQYWENNVLELTEGIHAAGYLKPDLTICMFITWGIAFLCVFKSINWTSKITYVTASLPPIMILALFVRGVLLDGASEGIRYFVTPNTTKLLEPKVWKDATLQNLYSLSLPANVMLAMGSYNDYNHNFYRDSFILCAANTGTSILSGFTVFATLGFMAKQQNTSIETVAESGPGLAFIVYPQALSMMPLAQFWSVLFFLTLFLLGMDSLFAFVETMVAVIRDVLPRTIKRRCSKSLLSFLIALSCALFGLTTTTQGGVYIITLVDNYMGSGWGVLASIVLETVAISWIYGVDKFYGHVCEMLKFKPRFPWFKYCWKYISPFICIGMFLFCLITGKPLTYNSDYVFPTWSIVIGWLMSLMSFIFIPGFAVAHLWKRYFGKEKNAKGLAKDSEELVKFGEDTSSRTKDNNPI